MDVAGLSTAVVTWESYGGLVAATFAARYPQRVAGLVLVSAIPPGWTPTPRPLRLAGANAAVPALYGGSLRLNQEIVAANSGVISGMKAAARHGFNALTHMFSPARMARRVRVLEGYSSTVGFPRCTCRPWS